MEIYLTRLVGVRGKTTSTSTLTYRYTYLNISFSSLYFHLCDSPCNMNNTTSNTQESDTHQNNTPNEPNLVGIKTCLEMVFKDEATRPGIRTFHDWKSKGYFPYHKIGKRIFLDPVQVRKALDKRFTVEAID